MKVSSSSRCIPLVLSIAVLVLGGWAAAQPTTVQGRILDPSDQPLEGIEVLLHPHQDRYQAGLAQLRREVERPVSARVLTDGRGLFKITISADSLWSLSVRPEGYLPMEVRARAFQPGFSLPDLVLSACETRQLSVSSRRRPAAGAVVRVLDSETGGEVPVGRSPWVPLGQLHVTDAQGRFEYQAVPGNEYSFHAWAPGSSLSLTAYQAGAKDRMPSMLGVTPGQELRVRVADPWGRPLPDVIVYKNSWVHSVSNAQGRLTVYRNPSSTGDQAMLEFLGPDGWGLRRLISLSNPPDPIVLSPPREMSVRLTGRNTSQTVSRGVVWIPEQNQAIGCDAAGLCRFEVWPTSRLIWLDGVGFTTQRFRVLGREPIELQLTEVAVVSGNVLGPRGEPLAEARVQARRADGGLSWNQAHFLSTGWTRDDGSFFLELPTPASEIALRASYPNLGGKSFRTRDPEVRIQLPAGAEISGLIVDSQGRPVEKALVSVHPHRGEQFQQVSLSRSGPVAELQAHSDSSGRFQISGVSPGKFLLSVWSHDLDLAPTLSPFFSLSQEDRARDLGQIELSSTRTVAGQVGDASGEPLSGATVTFSPQTVLPGLHWRMVDDPPDRWTASTDSRGQFQLEGVPSRPLHAAVQAEGYTPERIRLPIPDQGPLEVTLSRGVTVRGRVIDGQGKPIAKIAVYVMHRPVESVGDYWNPASVIRTDSQGRFQTPNLDAGHFKIDVRSEGMSPLTRPLGVLSEGDQRDLEIVVDKKGIVVRRRVLTPDGQPVRRASAELFPEALRNDPQDLRGRTTIINGKLELTAPQTGTYLLTVTSRQVGAQQVKLELKQGVNPVEIVLDPSNLMRFRVVDTDGRPVNHARLKIRSEDGFRRSINAHDGLGVLEVFRPLSAEVSAETEDSWARADFETGSQRGTSVLLRLRPKIPLEGRVTGLSKDQLARLNFHLSQQSLDFGSIQVRVDDEGKIFSAPLAPGTYRVNAGVADGPRLADRTLIVEPQQPSVVLDIDFQPGLDAQFQVLGNGRPLAARYSLVKFGRNVATGHTGDQGMISLQGLQPGDYQLLAQGTFGLAMEEVTLPQDSEKVLDLELIDISGDVLDQDGQPIASARVWQALNFFQLAQGSGGIRSNREGRFTIKGVTVDSGPLVIHHPDFARTSVYLPEPSQGAVRDLRVTMQPGGTGHLLLQGLDQAVAGSFTALHVDAMEFPFHTQLLKLSEDGRAEVRQLPADGNRLVLVNPHFQPVDISLSPDEVRQIQLKPAAQLKLTVPGELGYDPLYVRLLDPQGRPHTGGRLLFSALFSRSSLPEGAWIMRGGRVAIPSIPEGIWQVEVVMANGAIMQRELLLRAGQTHEVTFP